MADARNEIVITAEGRKKVDFIAAVLMSIHHNVFSHTTTFVGHPGLNYLGTESVLSTSVLFDTTKIMIVECRTHTGSPSSP